MEAAGFRVTCLLDFDRPTKLAGGFDGLARWTRMFLRTPFAGLDGKTASAVLHEAEEELAPQLFRDSTWFADYTRLRGRAVAL